MIKIEEVIDASLSELSSIFLKDQTTFESAVVCEYAKVVRTFLQGERVHISPQFTQMCRSDADRLILDMSRLRGQISKNEIQLELIESIRSRAIQFPQLEGEAYFVCGIASYYIEPIEKALSFNSKAFDCLNRQGLKKKAGRALLNKVSLAGRTDPHPNLISDFIFLAKYAKDCGDRVVEGACYVNIAREYQKSAKFELALDYSTQAIDCLESDAGSINYFFAHLIRGFIFFDKGEYSLCQFEIDRVLLSQHVELHEGAKALSNILRNREFYKIDESAFSPTLKEILSQYDASRMPAIGGHEKLLLESLLGSGKTRYELIEKIYPEKIPIAYLENRFKNLLTRIRKKFPGLIQRQNGQYLVSDRKIAEKILR